MADPPLPLPLRQLLQLPRPLRLLPPPVFQQLRLIQILRLVRLAWWGRRRRQLLRLRLRGRTR